MPDSTHQMLKGHYVQFHVRDIHLPEPLAVLEELHAADVLEGRVTDISDSGSAGNAFVVVEVNGLRQPCIVAVERILRAR